MFLQFGIFLIYETCRRSFKQFYDICRRMSWQCVYKQMNMIWHNFQRYDLNLIFLCDFCEEVFQIGFDCTN